MKKAYLWKHSFFNLKRTPRRSMAIISILAFGTLVLLLGNFYLEYMFWGLRVGTIARSGYFQIAPQGFWDLSREEAIFLSPEELGSLGDLLSVTEGVSNFSQELKIEGLIGTDVKATVLSGMGVDPQKASLGGYTAGLTVKDGVVLDPWEPEGIVVGTSVAERLGVQVGDWVNILLTTAYGGTNIQSAQVLGIASTGDATLDLYFTAVPIDFARELRFVEGAERVLVFVKEEERGALVMEEVQRGLKDLSLNFEMKDWRELNSFYSEIEGFYKNIYLVVILIISLLTFIASLEIISMSFFERFRELGTMRAIGNTKGEVLTMLLVEVVYYCVIGLLVGGLLGFGVARGVNTMGLAWIPPGSSEPVPFGFYIRLRFVLVPAAVVSLASLTAALFPALKCSQNEVVEVLKYE